MVKNVFRPRQALILLVWVTGSLSGTYAASVDREASDDATLGHGEDVGRQGFDVFAELDRRHNHGYVDFSVDLTMELRRGKDARPVLRALSIRQFEKAAGDKVLVVFNTPANIRGTALLTHTHADEVDDQWLFLPAFKRVKKIATRNKSGSFVQSEFSFEDLTVPFLHKYTYRLLRQEACASTSCFVVERRAKDKHSGYSKEHYWIDTDAYRTHRVEYFDRRGRLQKVLTLDEYRPYTDILWKPHLMVMNNQLNGRSTTLRWDSYQFDQGLGEDRDFSIASLRRVR